MIKRFAILLYLCCSFTGIIPTIPDGDKETLTLMREEEKLARDVYLTLDEKWDQVVFQHIAQAEVAHMQAVKSLLDQYKVEDPVAMTRDERGRFVHPPFQRLYDSLVTTGTASLEGAFRAGAFVEERDLQDLYEAQKATRAEDLKRLYGNLVRASEQHLRAFARNLNRVGVTYEPVILSKKEYQRIIGTGGGRGPGRGQGRGPGRKGQGANAEGCDPSCPHRVAECDH